MKYYYLITWLLVIFERAPLVECKLICNCTLKECNYFTGSAITLTLMRDITEADRGHREKNIEIEKNILKSRKIYWNCQEKNIRNCREKYIRNCREKNIRTVEKNMLELSRKKYS